MNRETSHCIRLGKAAEKSFAFPKFNGGRKNPFGIVLFVSSADPCAAVPLLIPIYPLSSSWMSATEFGHPFKAPLNFRFVSRPRFSAERLVWPIHRSVREALLVFLDFLSRDFSFPMGHLRG